MSEKGPFLIRLCKIRTVDADSVTVKKTPTKKTPANIATNVPANGPANGPANPVASDPVQPAVPLAKNQAAIAAKKKKQVKRQWMVLGFLATMALCLASALIVILTRGL